MCIGIYKLGSSFRSGGAQSRSPAVAPQALGIYIYYVNIHIYTYI